MKLITWNVNGLRAALKKDVLAWINQQAPDVLCLQEIKARPDQLELRHIHQLESTFPHIAWNPAKRPGYSGVATLTTTPPLDVQLGLGVGEFDTEGRVIRSDHPGFILFNLYVPNGGRDHVRVPFKLDFYAQLLDICDELHSIGEHIILCGDINTCHQEIDLRNPKENANTTGFLLEERAWINTFLAHGFIDVYRHLYPERVQYTWWTYRYNARKRDIGWRLDYFMVSESLVDQVQDAVINDDVLGSDHCPVTLLIDE
ncbi:MAG: exodeoxyribonuclease III [Chloroflexota bacterium]|nr:exodeoxyribonuclease III [Chloroflexota bacterium]